MKIELNVAWDERPYWREVARVMGERTHCRDHPDAEPDKVAVVIPPEGLQPRHTLAHAKPIVFVYCSAPGCHSFASFDYRALPKDVLPEPAVT